MKKSMILPIIFVGAAYLGISTAVFATSNDYAASDGVVTSTAKAADEAVDDTVEGTGNVIKGTGEAVGSVGEAVGDVVDDTVTGIGDALE
jgi:hypothetical protein